jgi:hypothetical protein
MTSKAKKGSAAQPKDAHAEFHARPKRSRPKPVTKDGVTFNPRG